MKDRETDFIQLRDNIDLSLCDLEVASYLYRLIRHAPDYMKPDREVQASADAFVSELLIQNISDVCLYVRDLKDRLDMKDFIADIVA